ncbi:MAG: flagellar export chaperone FliS [Rhodocyclaceae bacterium]
MFGYGTGLQQRAAAYARVEIETGVSDARPIELVLMLYDGALLAIAAAKQHMADADIEGKGRSLSKAIEIISNGLKASLNLEVGGELAGRLAALYDYMCQRLVYANLHDSQVTLDEVRSLLVELKEGWEEIGDAPPAAPAAGAVEGTR